ncbi:hypothetical protein GH714_015098 [Hevea brasiliensis]|uniref:Beta-glucosidase n=1 Tax=Hevea brasiliensis TaxID=3981 RepID=A0A6A6N5B5_HEVBR|nr:hypothetical protein GH714_015098 [Hevea brasiliensis]
MVMATKHSLQLLAMLIFLISLLALTKPTMADDDTQKILVVVIFQMTSFLGQATSAYQIEGEATTKGRGPSVWDTFSKETPERILDGSNGDVAVDFYNRFKEDIANVKNMGFKGFRMSISWSRVIPSKIGAFVTIFHWDTPQALEDKYGGFLSRDIVYDYYEYANLLFEEFGDRVKYWMTFNEPWSLSGFSYDYGVFAPGRCSSWVNRQCRAGNSATEPYIVAHHLLLSHAAVVQLYREKFKPIHGGQIGITLFTFWYEPLSNEPADVEAAKTALDFMFGLWMDPMTYGTYPRTVRDLVGDRLPKFTDEESKLLRGSYDFLGLQYYTSYYAKPNATVDPNHIRYKTDNHITETPYDYDGNLIGPQAYSSWFYIFPKGIRHLLNYTKDTYNNPVIYITENGVDNNNNETQPIEEALQDEFRINYYRKHLWNALGSLKNYSVNVKGYFAWSYLDNFEWNIGYTSRFGLYYVDYKDNLKRYPKDSAKWFTKFLKHSPKKPLQSNKIYEVTSRNSRKVGKYYIM